MNRDDFEKKYYLEIQKYKEFKKENFSGVEKFSHTVRKVLIFISCLIILFCVTVTIIGLIMFLLFTVLK